MLEKLQNFLKNVHKFDKEKPLFEQVDLLERKFQHFLKAVKDKDDEKIKRSMKELLIEMILYANTQDISVADLLQKGFNL